MDINTYIDELKTLMNYAYVPITNYRVGAILIGESGKRYTGCNVENQGIHSICAERVAFTKAISEGEKKFKAILVAGGKSVDELDHCLPCGYCRQFMSEFVDDDFLVYVLEDGKYTEYRLGDLLPHSFKF